MERKARMVVRLIGVIMMVIAFYLAGDFNLSLIVGALAFILIMMS